nr:MAG TPA: hypothetical protein [Caudoviricetes sp.]
MGHFSIVRAHTANISAALHRDNRADFVRSIEC